MLWCCAAGAIWTRSCLDRRTGCILKLAAKGTPVLGVCGGYQMLGHTLADPDGEESGTPCTLPGLGLLPTDTVFNAENLITLSFGISPFL